MSVEISKVRGLEEFPNPLALSNLVHYLVAAICGLAGLWLGIQATAGGGFDFARFGGALLLIWIAGSHVAWAWRYSYFNVAPENIGPLSSGVHDTQVAYVEDLIHKGMPILDQTTGALANRLLRWAPGLRHAPRFIQAVAISQWERSLMSAAILLSFVAAMALTWGQPSQAFVAWCYLVGVTVRVFNPLSAFRRLFTSVAIPSDLGSSVKRSDLFLLGVLAVAPLAARVVAARDINALVGFTFSPLIIWATLALLVTAVVTGWLCYLALLAQTEAMERSKADESVRDLANRKADMRNAFQRLDTFLHRFIGPESRHGQPARAILPGRDPEIPATKGSTPFFGLRYLESAPRASAGNSPVSLGARLSEVLGSRRERPLFVLSIAGLVCVVAFVAMAVWFLDNWRELSVPFEHLLVLTVMLGFLGAAEYAFDMAHFLWQRFDFTSEVLKISVKGQYEVNEQVLRDQLTAQSGIVRTGSETTAAIHAISGTSLRVAHFIVHSTSFSVNGPRTVTAVVPRFDTIDVIEETLERSVLEAREARKVTLREESDVKAAYGAQASLPGANAASAVDQPAASPLISGPAD